MCSDGLNKHVSDTQMQKTLLDKLDPQSACEELVEMAKQGGGSDNITVITARFLYPQSPNNRMQLVMSLPSEQIVLQDLEIAASELDTSEEPGEADTLDVDVVKGDMKDTIDFS